MVRKVFDPIRINKVVVKNRFGMAAMGTGLCVGLNGRVSQRIIDYYEARAKGGTGLIIVENAMVDWENGRNSDSVMSADDDRFIPGLAELAGAIKRHGACACLQINHCGQESRIDGQKVGPSAVPHRTGTARALTKTEIAGIVARYAAAAGRAKRAGFDAVEFHGAHRYLIAQFLSPEINKRTDEYGGDGAGRARFLVEILRAVRGTVGPDFPVWTRMNAREKGIPGGLTLEDAQQTARLAQAAGADALDVSGWALDAPGMREPGNLMPLAGAIKSVVTIPVMAVGGRMTPEIAEQAISESRIDIALIGRGLIVDPDFVNKVAAGKLEEIRPCIGCWECVPDEHHVGNGRWEQKESIRCTVNAAMGHEREMETKPDASPRHIVVVGGGPAGMEAARVAALRGHRVTLLEKSASLGGLLTLAAMAPRKQYVGDLMRYLTRQVTTLGVDVRLGTQATADLILSLKPDAVILATGAEPVVPDIPGVDRADVVKAVDVLAGKAEVGQRVVIIGGALVGCETAEILAMKGKQVTVTRRGSEMATGLSDPLRQALLKTLAKIGVSLRPGVKYKGLTKEGLIIINQEGRTETIPADTVVLAAGFTPRADLFQALEGKVPRIDRIGDCLEARGIKEAIHEGARLCRL
jgi:2,4-dienoyl-CoA reductase-like NADH-dependent reductase (Old Yellow Enzyme family)/pyruvate/2-oxoglutarate dehydrogenase complex dihydrolipoamide dehydrogenase (E3) component